MPEKLATTEAMSSEDDQPQDKKGVKLGVQSLMPGTANNVPKVKEKRRNNEKRKEKSRDAARCRRSRETEIFTDLANVLPARREEVDQLDKASIMRLSIAYLKVRGMLDLFPNVKEKAAVAKTDEPYQDEDLFIQALDGFLFIVSEDGDVTYVSENISEFLGIQQVDMIGQQVWEYSHQCDHEELREILNGRRGSKDNDEPSNMHRDMLMRLKCTLTSRGRSVNIKSASYKVIHISGHIAVNESGERQLIAVGRPLPHPSNIEVPLDSGTFLTKHSLDMKFSYADDKMLKILGYQPEDLLNKSLYEYHHAGDSESLMGSFKNVISKGQAETCRYRFLARTGGYCWVVTQATLVYDKQKPQSVVCVNYVISGIENKNDIYTCGQLEASTPGLKESSEVKKEIVVACETKKATSTAVPSKAYPYTSVPIKSAVHTTSPIVKEHRPRSVTASVFAPVTEIPASLLELQQQLTRHQQQQQAAQTVTASVFAPISSSLSQRVPQFKQPIATKTTATSSQQPTTPDTMNKGYMMFLAEGSDLTMLKEEPDDLTHLAPTAGDACIPLDESAPLFGEMFDGLILPDGYGTLLPDDMGALEAHQASAHKDHIDPFMNYRDESSDTMGTPNLLSPCGLSKSPNGSSLPSLCSPNSLSQDDDFAFMTMNCEDGIDLTMRAPYIPMNESDDLPLLTEDLMWSAFSEEPSLHKDIKDAIHNESIKESSLASLLSPNSAGLSMPPHHMQHIVNHHQQQLTHQHNQQLQLSRISVTDYRRNVRNSSGCKREVDIVGLDTDDGTATDDDRIGDGGVGDTDMTNSRDGLVCPADVMDQIYNKHCTTNNDTTWSMNDLLQLNTLSTNSNHSNRNNIINNNRNNNSNNNNNNNNNNNDNNNHNNQNHNNNNKNLLNPMLTTISVIKKADRLNKRPLTATTIDLNACTKRIKGGGDVQQQQHQQHLTPPPQPLQHHQYHQTAQQSAPQLLQQLMAPTPQQQRARAKGGVGSGCGGGGGGGLNKNDPAKWDMENTSQNQICGLSGQQQLLLQQQQQAASNSVLKNLLDDVSMKPPDILLDDETMTDYHSDKTLNFSASLPTSTTPPDTLKLLKKITVNNLNPICDNVKQRIREPDDTSPKRNHIIRSASLLAPLAEVPSDPVRDPHKHGNNAKSGCHSDDDTVDDDDDADTANYSVDIGAEYMPDIADYPAAPPDSTARQISFSCLDVPLSCNIQSLLMELTDPNLTLDAIIMNDTDVLMRDNDDLPAELERWSCQMT